MYVKIITSVKCDGGEWEEIYIDTNECTSYNIDYNTKDGRVLTIMKDNSIIKTCIVNNSKQDRYDIYIMSDSGKTIDRF